MFLGVEQWTTLCLVLSGVLLFFYIGEDCPLWMIPITISTSDDPTHAKKQILMDKPELTLVLKDVKPEQWIKVSNNKKEIFFPKYISDSPTYCLILFFLVSILIS